MQHDITPQEARERLAQAQAATDRRAGDRRVHAVATAGFGLLIGAFLTVSRLVEDTSVETLAVVFYVLLLLGLAGWQTRETSTWPRRARRTSYLGLGGTVMLFLGAVITFNVVDAKQEVVLLVLAGLVVAAPMVVAAVLIDRGDRGDRGVRR